MRWFEGDPQITRVAQRLGLSPGAGVDQIREHALSKVKEHIASFGSVPSSLGELRRLLAARLSVRIEFIRKRRDIERLGKRYDSTPLQLSLKEEFLERETEGILINHPAPVPGGRKYLAVIDARGSQASRAYFTAWHELAHLLVTPPAKTFTGVRRAPTAKEIRFDAEEALVDHVAAHLAFFEPVFGPKLREAIEQEGELSFHAIEKAKKAAAPRASTFAAARASIRLIERPACFIQVAEMLQKEERQRLTSTQLSLPGLEFPDPEPALRIQQIYPNVAAQEHFRLTREMRVPEESILRKAFEASHLPVELEGDEDQSWWTSNSNDSLPALPLKVHAVCRGRYTYGLVLGTLAN